MAAAIPEPPQQTVDAIMAAIEAEHAERPGR